MSADMLLRRKLCQTGIGLTALHSMGGVVGASPLAHKVVQKPVRVLAASDLKFALTDLKTQYERDFGVKNIELTFGSSGNFTRQIVQGLAADIFMSADAAYVAQLVQAGRTQGDGVRYATGRLALLLPTNPSRAQITTQITAQTTVQKATQTDATLKNASHSTQTSDALATRSVMLAHIQSAKRFAIANPEHAPYGRAAREVLQALDVWKLVTPKLVLGENIAQATQFVLTGSAQAGITALPLALSASLHGRTRHMLLAEQLHTPLVQHMVLLKNASAPAQHFFGFLQSPAAKTTLARYGLR